MNYYYKKFIWFELILGDWFIVFLDWGGNIVRIFVRESWCFVMLFLYIRKDLYFVYVY